MRNLQDATERICELKGDMIAHDVLTTSLLLALQPETSERFVQRFERASEAARTVLVNAPISDVTLEAFERGIQRTLALMGVYPGAGLPMPSQPKAREGRQEAVK